MNDKENKNLKNNNLDDINKKDLNEDKKEKKKQYKEKKVLTPQEKASKNIKRIMIVFFILLIALISYIAYFGVFQDPTIDNKTGNTAKLAIEKQVIRGNIYDTFGQALAETKVDGLEQTIYYPFGKATSAVVGYVSPRYGTTGLESTYNKDLSTYTSDTSIWDDFNIFKLFQDRDKKQYGDNVYTTIDAQLQEVAYKELSQYKAGAVVAIDPKTGAVLASVSYPDFDPNNLSTSMKEDQETGEGLFYDRATQGLLAPGSTFKMVTMTSGLENIPGLGNETFNDPGYIQLGDYKLTDEGSVDWGKLTLNGALSVSSNVIFGGIIAVELGNAKLKATAEAFGFNENIPTVGFNLAESQFPTYSEDQEADIAMSGMGQAQDLATPTEMALIAGTIANDGVMMRPYLVSKVVASDGKTVEDTSIESYRTVMSEAVAQRDQEAMAFVVDQRAWPSKYDDPDIGDWNEWPEFRDIPDAGAKTGAAQTGKDGDEVDSWFAGYSGDTIAVAVVVQDTSPEDAIAGHIAGAVMNTYLKQLGMIPDSVDNTTNEGSGDMVSGKLTVVSDPTNGSKTENTMDASSANDNAITAT
ncbi:MAG: penicillin-binding transpeptidase domain-containing protein [Clostridium perfringens]|nr:penicillin-binding transpeptidase domain-containing protein [Clostridium perfringens]